MGDVRPSAWCSTRAAAWACVLAVGACDGGLGVRGGERDAGARDAGGQGEGEGGAQDAGAGVDAGGPDPLAPFRAACPWMDAREWEEPSDAFFAPGVIQELALELDAADWQYQLDNPDLEEMRPAALVWCGVRFEGVGMRFRRSSHPAADLPEGDPKNPILVDLSEYAPGQKLLGLRHVNLDYGNDLLLVAERANWELLAAAGATASRVGSAVLTVQGALAGVFSNIERVDRSYARVRWGEDDGNLYKHQYCGTFVWQGPDPGPYLEDPQCYELKTNEDVGDIGDLIRVIDVLENTPEEELEAALPSVLDVDALLPLFAALQALGYADTPNANGNNFYSYHVLATDRFAVVPWDLDGGFWEDDASCEHPADTIGWDLFRISRCHDRLPLFQRVVARPAWRQRYLEHVRAIVDGPFSPRDYRARVEAIVAELRPALAGDPHRRGDDAAWEAAVASLLDRNEARVAAVLDQLATEGL